MMNLRTTTIELLARYGTDEPPEVCVFVLGAIP